MPCRHPNVKPFDASSHRSPNALQELPEDAFSERVQLRDLQTSLRAVAVEPTEGRSRESLESELRQLTRRLEQLLKDRTSQP